MKKLLIIAFLFIGFAGALHSQQNCAVILKEAEKMFDNGVIENVPALLDECLKNGFSKDEKIRAYRLIIISYLFDDKKDKAEEYMLKMLKLEPEYEINQSVDPSEFISLLDKYRTLPVYSLGVFGGVNYSAIRVTQIYGVNNVSNTAYEYNSSGMGYQFGIRVNRYIYKGFEASAEFGLAQSNYEYIDSLYDYAVVSFDEKQTRIDIPISFTWQLELKKIKPFVRVGFNNSLMLNAFGTSVRRYTDNSHRDITGSDIGLDEFRSKYNASVIGAIGAKYKIKRGHLFLELRYMYGLMNQVNENNRYSSPELIYKYYYIDDDFTLNNYMLSFGYMYSFYKPKKKDI
ncbi:MAG: hypothetical protein A2W91_17395 [Bacteroidetes bacterium GWF2_38_335]|nr:MAG: hypothetical protein A2W91_17395 [Bacteroidetes bacterium GWF2_38_335]OFY78640.1 MAG: hypothetical protein A2281_16420 [Bacteroidetes bacterium RIFOXYA12_FULL_38_20]HBS88364.1 hypothetical protein [Bacteroidales bacterium]